MAADEAANILASAGLFSEAAAGREAGFGHVVGVTSSSPVGDVGAATTPATGAAAYGKPSGNHSSLCCLKLSISCPILPVSNIRNVPCLAVSYLVSEILLVAPFIQFLHKVEVLVGFVMVALSSSLWCRCCCRPSLPVAVLLALSSRRWPGEEAAWQETEVTGAERADQQQQDTEGDGGEAPGEAAGGPQEGVAADGVPSGAALGARKTKTRTGMIRRHRKGVRLRVITRMTLRLTTRMEMRTRLRTRTRLRLRLRMRMRQYENDSENQMRIQLRMRMSMVMAIVMAMSMRMCRTMDVNMRVRVWQRDKGANAY